MVKISKKFIIQVENGELLPGFFNGFSQFESEGYAAEQALEKKIYSVAKDACLKNGLEADFQCIQYISFIYDLNFWYDNTNDIYDYNQLTPRYIDLQVKYRQRDPDFQFKFSSSVKSLEELKRLRLGYSKYISGQISGIIYGQDMIEVKNLLTDYLEACFRAQNQIYRQLCEKAEEDSYLALESSQHMQPVSIQGEWSITNQDSEVEEIKAILPSLRTNTGAPVLYASKEPVQSCEIHGRVPTVDPNFKNRYGDPEIQIAGEFIIDLIEIIDADDNVIVLGGDELDQRSFRKLYRAVRRAFSLRVREGQRKFKDYRYSSGPLNHMKQDSYPGTITYNRYENSLSRDTDKSVRARRVYRRRRF